MRSLLAREAERHGQARHVLATLDVLAAWAPYGEPVLCGSVAYGLVVAPDIDVEITGPTDPGSGQKIVTQWLKARDVRRVLYLDALDDEDGGLGWEARYDDGRLMWTVQMWLLAPDYQGPRSASLVEPMRRRLDDETRCTILRLKEAIAAGDAAIPSIDVYRAVLDHGITQLDHLRRWHARHLARKKLTNWTPMLHPVGSGDSEQTQADRKRGRRDIA